MTDLQKRLITCFSAVLPDLSQEDIPLATVNSVGSWDSLATVTLIMVIEEEFGVQVPPGDLEQFVSFELILDYLGRTISERTNPACVGTERPYTRPA
jgi:acyl carrier protein